MSNKENLEFKKSYTFIFSFFYLVQGLYNGIQYVVLPIWLISMVETIDFAAVLEIFSVTVIPWALKFFIGILNDKFGFKKFGRRKPFIFVFGCWAGVWFIITGMLLPLNLSDPIYLAMVCALMWNIGIAIADTSVDGLILDVTPKKGLGKVQGYTWSMNLLGSSALAIVLGAIFFMFNAIPLLFVLEGGLLFFACFFPFFIKESPIPEEVKVWKSLKKIIGKGKNWKVLIFSLIDSIPYAVVILLYGLFVIIYLPDSPIHAKITSISLASESLDLFIIYALLGAVSGIGVIIGCLITGKIADKNRRLAVYFAHLIYIPFLCISVFFRGSIILGIIMMIILGAGEGALMTSFQSIRGDIAKQYPEIDSTYYAIVISILNGGMMVGYFTAAMLLTIFSNFYAEFFLIYFWIIIIMAGFQTLSFLIFMTINPKEYEFAHHLEGPS